MGGRRGFWCVKSRAESAECALAFAVGDWSYESEGGGGRSDVSGMDIQGA